jgi:hypothetical protein
VIDSDRPFHGDFELCGDSSLPSLLRLAARDRTCSTRRKKRRKKRRKRKKVEDKQLPEVAKNRRRAGAYNSLRKCFCCNRVLKT